MRSIIQTLSLSVLICHGVLAAEIYVYTDAAGNHHYFDHPAEEPHAYRLVKTYEADDYFGSVNSPSVEEEQVVVWDEPVEAPQPSAFDAMIVSHAMEHGLEPALLKAIVHVESGFRPDAVSPKGAVGLMQLMPETAKRYGVTLRTNPIENLTGGCRYMLHLLDRYGSDLDLALAAYNAGESAVAKYAGIPPYPETTRYVYKVKELLAHYRENLNGT